MTDKLTETVARAHYEAYISFVKSCEPDWEDLEESLRLRMIDAMKAAIAAVEAAAWQPIEDAPKDGSYIAIHDSGGIHTVKWDNSGEKEMGWVNESWWLSMGEDGFKEYYPTHFRPLPPAPKE